MIDLQPLGDRAVLARFSTESEAARWAGAIRALSLPGMVDVSLAYASAAVYADPDLVANWDAWVEGLRSVVPEASGMTTGRVLRIPVWYGGEDLGEVAQTVGLSEAEVVALHSGQDYRVFAVGFQPGFPYAGYLPEALSGIPRRASPRTRIPGGSVAIAGRQTGIYPRDSPGGWHLLGQTPCRVVDVEAGVFPIEPGDWLRFEPITREAFENQQNPRVWPVEVDLGPNPNGLVNYGPSR